MQISASSQVTCRPHCAIIQFIATVLIATVFPPVFGPVITIPVTLPPISNCNGTHIALSIKGCLADFNFIRLSVFIIGFIPYCSILSFPFAKAKSNFSIIVIFCFIISAISATIAVKVYKILLSSFSSSNLNKINSS